MSATETQKLLISELLNTFDIPQDVQLDDYLPQSPTKPKTKTIIPQWTPSQDSEDSEERSPMDMPYEGPLDDSFIEQYDYDAHKLLMEHLQKVSTPPKSIISHPPSTPKRSSLAPQPEELTRVGNSLCKDTNLDVPSPNRVCTPKKNLKPNKTLLKLRSKNALNLIVHASSGELADATMYATEINTYNSEGIPIPKNVQEQVTIPINEEPSSPKSSNAAIIRAYMYDLPVKSNETPIKSRIGFYTAEAFSRWRAGSPMMTPNKVCKPRKTVRWADKIEW